MRAIIVSVDYGDLLSLTLPYNLHHFESVCIVTSSGDSKTIEIAREYKTELFVSDLFWDKGAVFNKWLPLERGLDKFGRHGWMVLMDADVLWPKRIPKLDLKIGNLYTPRRRMLTNLQRPIPKEEDWRGLILFNEIEFAGYSQIFHAEDPHLGLPPWHEIDWRHAGGADSFFQKKWPSENKIRPRFEVLHLGDAGKNWCGRATPYLDGTIHPDAQQRLRMLRDFRLRRSHGPHRFDHEKYASPES